MQLPHKHVIALLHLQTVCKEMNVKRVVFLTDVAGVYDKPPQMAGEDGRKIS